MMLLALVTLGWAGQVDIHIASGASEWVIEVRPTSGPVRTVRVPVPRTPEEQQRVLALIESLSAEIDLPLAPPPEPPPRPEPIVSAPAPKAAPARPSPPAPVRVSPPVPVLARTPAPESPPLPAPAPAPVTPPAPPPPPPRVAARPPEPVAPMPEPVPAARVPPLALRGWLGMEVPLHADLSIAPGLAAGVGAGRDRWFVGVRGGARLRRTLDVAPDTSLFEQFGTAELGCTVLRRGGVMLLADLGVARRRIDQFSAPVSRHVLPTAALGAGIEPAWNDFGLSLVALVEQDLVPTRLTIDPGADRDLRSTSARVEARLWLGRGTAP